MSDQLTLALEDKAWGQAVALEAKPVWRDAAMAWFRGLPAGAVVTADDLVEAIGLPRESETNKNNAVGAAFTAARSLDLMEPVGYAPSKRRQSRGRIVRTWRRTW